MIDYLTDVLDVTTRRKTIDKTISDLRGIEFETIAVRGVSGLLIGSIVALEMNKVLAIVRKPGEGTHSFYSVEGAPTGRYIIIDDLICSGKTVETIIDAMKAKYHFCPCVGVYCYYSRWLHNTADDESSRQKTNLILANLGTKSLNRQLEHSQAVAA